MTQARSAILRRDRRHALALILFVSAAPIAPAADPADDREDEGILGLYDPMEQVEFDCRTVPAVPGPPMLGVAGRGARRAAGRFGEGFAVSGPGQFLAYPQKGVLSPQLGAIAVWFRPKVLASTAAGGKEPGARYVFYCGSGKTNSFHCYLEGKQLALVIHAADGKPQSIKCPVSSGGNWQHVGVAWEGREARLFLGGNPAGAIESPSLPSALDGPLYVGNDEWGDKPLVGEVDEVAAWAVPRRTFALNQPLRRTAKAAAAAREQVEALNRQTVLPFLEALARGPCDEARFLFGRALMDAGEYARARETFWDVVGMADAGEIRTHADFGVAEAFAREGACESALSVLRKLGESKNAGTAAHAAYWTGKVYLMMQDYPRAFAQCERLIATYPESLWANYAYYSTGTGHFQLKDYERALGAFQLVGTAGSGRMRVAELARPLTVRLADADLLARASAQRLAVRVESSSGDWEDLVMDPAESRGVHIGTLAPVLGAAAPNDGKLQVCGSDRIRITYQDRTVPAGRNASITAEELPIVDDGSIEILDDAFPARMAEVDQLVAEGYLTPGTLRRVKVLPAKTSPEIAALLPEDGSVLDPAALRRALHRTALKPGQAFFVQVCDGDGDTSDQPDRLAIRLTTGSGAAATFELAETGPHTGVFGARIPTRPADAQPAAAPSLPIAIQDTVTAEYDDQENLRPGAPQKRSASVSVRYSDAVVSVNKMIPSLEASVPVVRFLPGDILELKVQDKDRDMTAQSDEIKVVVRSSGGDQESVVLYETQPNSGVFSGNLRTREGTASSGDGVVEMKAGDQMAVVYEDRESSESRAPVAREIKTEAVRHTTAVVRIVDEQGQPVKTVAPGDLLRVRVTDPDAVQTGTERHQVTVASSGGHTVSLPLAVQEEDKAAGVFREADWVRISLGDSGSADEVTVIGRVGKGAAAPQSARALNVMGNDTITVTYMDAVAADGQTRVPRTYSVGIAAEATLRVRPVSDREGEEGEMLKPGDRLTVRVDDRDRDVSAEDDRVTVELRCGADSVRLTTRETMPHSGIFEAMVRTALGAVAPADDVLTVGLGAEVEASYEDEKSPNAEGPVTRVARIKVIPGADGEIALFSKCFLEDALAADAFSALAESYFRIAARKLKTEDTPAERLTELALAAELAARVATRWPESDQAVAAEMILANVHRSRGQYDRAIAEYERVAARISGRPRPASAGTPEPARAAEGERGGVVDPMESMAAYALYEIGVAYFDQGRTEEASRAWARLIFRYPDSPLVPKAVLRKGEAYYKAKDYGRAAQVFEKFVEYHPKHALVDKVMYKAGLSHYLMKSYRKAAEIYSNLLIDHPDSTYAGDAQYWLGESLYHGGDRRKALVEFQRVLNDYPNCAWRQQAQLRVIELE